MKLAIRQDDDRDAEQETRINVTASTEHAARRVALDRLYARQYLASRFTQIQVRKDPTL